VSFFKTGYCTSNLVETKTSLWKISSFFFFFFFLFNSRPKSFSMPRVAPKVFLGTALACAGGALALSPGIDVSLSSTGFSFFGTKAVKMAIAGAQTMPLPDIPEQKFSCAGHCYASVSDLAVRSLACGAPSFKYGAARNSVAAAVPACAASASAHYRIHRSTFPSASCSGDVTVSISGFGISGAIDVGESGGALKLSSASVALGVSDIGMHFSGDCKLLADIAKKVRGCALGIFFFFFSFVWIFFF
jgi:hypothetical protein